MATSRIQSLGIKRKSSNKDDKQQGKKLLPLTETQIEDKLLISDNKLSFSFFNVNCEILAHLLLGQNLVRCIGGQRVSGKIVETEAYLGLEDKAAHTYNGKRTERNEAMFMAPGTAYVYNIYGMYCCLNISSQGEGCAVLIRALEPQEGLEIMKTHRSKNSTNSTKELKVKELTNGPSKLCQALAISKNDFNKCDLTNSELLWLEQGETIPDEKIVCSPRINIGYAEEWQEKPLRFYILGNSCVSKRDKKAEEHRYS
ncbi:DNA-3-methyladenine glycosylase [Biomphalaria glabrata]|uniref:DNA-3-methyladenine glycosylase n=1 Tax=Biomphalaria glabrata TaxID=6526 RepID=A0A9U8ENQ8_BIOGL|nr:uncharacterized protein LOC106079626 [Biomphalaria glabrata]XP_013096281.2 uncharacterized protein LOC106079626 [Biomphalaria glabrata]XP_055875272.1 uncharacterized protein LOC106079626 [Biomphalaria glabrata]KAI8766451.1 putative DNA-3-methyladenine glycosylase [Biomphalaria glabrata]